LPYLEPIAAMSFRDLNVGLEFRFLGQFSIRGLGGWQPGPSLKKGGELLQYLGIYPRRIATKDELAAAFWPELDPEAVAHRLHLAASGARGYLRHLLGGADAIVAVTGGYAWSTNASVRSDVEAFLALCRSDEPESLETAITLYGGEFLAGETADWLQPTRVRCAAAFACALEALAQRAEAARDFPAALSAGFKLQDAERGHEGATRLIMRCFAALGLRDRAERQYESLRDYLRQRLGVEPTHETTALARQLKSGRRVYGEFAERGDVMMVR
jgi:DNA-binding SARP family transcriptional activator